MQDPELWGGKPQTGDQGGDHHLRSTQEVSRYDIHATDGDIGSVDDFIIDDENWTIRYLIVDTGNWWPGKKVLVSPEWIERVSWSDEKVFAKLTRDQIKASPAYVAGQYITAHARRCG